ncbi:MAG: hypothetical protein RJB38_346 [Pseudomonadota bacterium]|jgi:septal ring factor EnvC (AmiA/AmiB activator)
MITRNVFGTIVGIAFLTMGLSMPSCPGQQAMQQQIDALSSSEKAMTNKIGALEGQIKSLKDDLEQTKTMLGQISKTAMDQTSTLERLDESVKALQTKAAEKPKAAEKAKSATAKKK